MVSKLIRLPLPLACLPNMAQTLFQENFNSMDNSRRWGDVMYLKGVVMCSSSQCTIENEMLHQLS
jgi:hypothetical protein